MFLHEEYARAQGTHGDVVNAVADFGVLVGNILGPQSAVNRLPAFASVVTAEGARCGDGDPHPLRIAGVKNNGMQAHAACPRLPFGAGAVAAQAGKFFPILAAVGRAEDGGVFHAGVDRIGILERRLQMPHALEFPRTLSSVIPLMRGERLAGFGGGIVSELVAGHFWRTWGRRFSGGRSRLVPGLAAVIRALNDLSEPAARLRGVDSIWISGRSLEVIHLPAGKMRAADIPFFTLAV